MANNIADYLENKLLEHSVGKTSFTMPSVWLALFTAAPGESGGGTEVSGGSYARLALAGADWASASGGSISNANALTFATATADWGTIVGIALIDSSSAAGSNNYLWYGTLTTNRAVQTGDTFRFAAGTLTLSLN
jgi:hypothetical protein